MSITIQLRAILGFIAGVAATIIAVFVFQSVTADAADSDDSTFVPISPCRLFDTRPAFKIGLYSTFGGKETKKIQAHGANGDCTIPTEAVGLSLNATAVGASASTFVTIWPDGARPDASSLNPSPGQPPTPNAVTTQLSATGSFEVFNLQGAVNVFVDVNGYYTRASLQQMNNRIAALETGNTTLKADIAALKATDTTLRTDIAALKATDTTLKADVAALKALTESMSTETVDGQPAVRFSGVNVQVVDGSGDTEGTVNGRGNLIVGYNQDLGTVESRARSHNLIVGDGHTYSSYGGVVFGRSNNATGPHVSVSGGCNNTASGTDASVSGGLSNTANGTQTSVSGGTGNIASGLDASVSGGPNNRASGFRTSVSGGGGNTARGNNASVSGGIRNVASGQDASVSGGGGNTASGLESSVSGGGSNSADGNSASVSAGSLNLAIGTASSISGGFKNTANSSWSTIGGGGGDDSEASGSYSFIAGGNFHLANAQLTTIIGGSGKTCSVTSAIC